MSSKRVPSYCLHKASGRAVVRIGGKDHYLGQHGTVASKRAYKKLIKEWEATSRSPSFGLAKDQATIAMLQVGYQDHCDQYYPKSRKSEAVMTRIAFRFLVDYQDTPACEFGAMALKAVRDEMLSTIGARGKPLSRGYVNKQIQRIVRGFSWAAENEMISVEVYLTLKNVKPLKRGRTSARETEDIEPVPDAKVDQALAHMSTVVADMVRVQRLTGMRPGELVTLTPSMIDKSREVWVAELVDHKLAYKEIERMVYIGPQAKRLISKYLDRPSDAPLFSPIEAEAERRAKQQANRVTPLSCGNTPGSNVVQKRARQPGTRYTSESYNRAIAYACSKVWPVPKGASKLEASEWKAKNWWRANQLRHSAATRIRATSGIEAAQVALGHKSITTTERYAKPNKEAGIAMAAEVG